jgi:hypothetical protein
MGCLVTTLVVAALLVVAVVAGVYVVKQMFPTSDSATQAASCAIMRVFVSNAESGIQQSDASEAEKADLRRAVQELRSEFEQQCGPLR